MSIKLVHDLLLLALVKAGLVLYHIAVNEDVAVLATALLHVVAWAIYGSAGLLGQGSELFMILVHTRAQELRGLPGPQVVLLEPCL